MVDRFHLDTDFLILALSTTGPERRRLREISATDAAIEMSAIAWYEFCLTCNTHDFDGIEGLRVEGS